MTEWTPAMKARLIALLPTGMPCSKIGKEIGVSKNGIVSKRRKLGLPERALAIRMDTEKPSVQPIYYGKSPTLPPLPSLIGFYP